jgi:periplasmic divalent cation tolerance protein
MEEADRIAGALVEGKHAACVTRVGPVRSVYRWKGEVERADEVLLIAKTRTDRFEELRRAVLAAHSYEVPEIIALPIEAGETAYLNWIDENVGG